MVRMSRSHRPPCVRKTCLMIGTWLWTMNSQLAQALVSRAASRFAITDVMLVAAASDQHALAYCESQDNSTSWTTAGVPWTDVAAPSARLCIQRRPMEQLVQEDPTAPVLTRIAVIEEATNCPRAMNLLANVKVASNAAVVCTQTSLAADALLKQNFISAITITSERDYNNQFSGWTTLPANVSMDLPFSTTENSANGEAPPSPGTFISYQRQVLPIVAFQILDQVEPEDAFRACEDLESHRSAFWEQAGDGFVDLANGTKRRKVCVKRDVNAQNSNQKIVTDLEMVSTPSGQCSPGFASSIMITASMYLCGKFVKSSADFDQVFVGDVALVRTSDKEFSDRLMPGAWSGFSIDLNGDAHGVGTFLLYRHAGAFELTSPETNDKPPLRARQNGSSLQFKIVQFADLHFAGDPNFPCRNSPKGMNASDCTESLMTEFMNNVLDLEKPDMVVFTGDNVQAMSSAKRLHAMYYATKPVEERAIPWAMVFGNHDEESGFSREQMYQVAVSLDHSYIQHGPAQVEGVGNYELTVVNPGEDTTALRMYFLDSHAAPDRRAHPTTTSDYDWVRQNQIDYYRMLSDSHRHDRVPALMFFHIPLPEYEAASQHALSGEKNEKPCSPSVNTNLFATLVEQAEVKAVFVGHDHLNEYCYQREGIQLCYGGGIGFGRAYGSDSFARRVRVIEWTQDHATGKRTIRSWKRHWDAIHAMSNGEILYQE